MIFLLSNIEIAEHLNLSIKTIESHITKAFSILHKKVNNKVEMQTFLFLLFKTNRLRILA